MDQTPAQKKYMELLKDELNIRLQNGEKDLIIKYIKEDWINKEITDLINLRNSLWRQIKLNPNDNTIRKHYSTVKKEVKTMIGTRKKNYYLSLFQNCSNNPKKTWEVVNSLSLNKTKEKCIPPKLISTFGLVTEGNAICELFNTFFTSIGADLAKEIPDIYHESNDNLHMYNDTYTHTITLNELSPCSNEELSNIINNLDNNTSTGVDGISTKAIKCIKDIIVDRLSNCVNKCLSQGIFPDTLKIAKVSPIHKSGPKTDPSNYRPVIESHYLRAQTTREFISSDKSLADIYRDYKRLRERDELPVATSSTFNRIFNTEFNISFFVPKKDQCDLCERFKNSDEKEKRKLIQEYEEHLKEKTLARTEKENDKNRKDGTVVAVYDLQAVLQIPKGQISLFFYKSRINCLNFTISDLRAKDVICYFWDETEGKRGAVEIGSCILDYIKSQVDQYPNKEIDVIFYSDNCGGQQKNKFLLSAYAYAVNKLTVKSITHKFLIRGHSQNEGDNVHSVIEKQIKRYLQSGPIYIPEQYKTLIVTAKKTGKPYKVVEMTHSKFYDMKALQESWGSNFNIDEKKNQIKWHDIKVLRVEKEHPEAHTMKKLHCRMQKKKDIQELIDKNVIPKSYYDIYYKYLLDNIDN
ncbi:unnamed protein product [Euphydryas editha]|uniref:DUF7869 domain-containing protein n=1 Tax=Euphydryas editha TaxID=104508 RepID=A0AAU9U1B3_EUPED|nr:unnamed protein product [Euphydryas editha]